MDASIYAIVLYPCLSELLGTTSHSTVGYYGSIILAVFLVGWALGGLVFGRLADQIGRVKTLTLSILVYAICTGLCALAHDWIELAILRFLVGFGIGGELSVGAIMLSEHWKGTRRLHAVSFMATSWGAGYFLTALLNWGIGDLGWRYLFAAGLVPAILTFYIRRSLTESKDFETVKSTKKRLKSKDKNSLTEAEKNILTEPLEELFKSENLKKLLTVIGITSCGIIGYWAVLSWVPAWINQLTGTQAVNERSIAAVVMNTGTILGAALSGLLILKIGRQNCVRLSFAGVFICCLGLFLTSKTFGTGLLIWLFFAGFFSIISAVTVCVYVPEIFQSRIQGTAFGLAFNFGRIFAALTALTGGQLIMLFNGDYARAGAIISSVYLFGIFCSFFMVKTNGEPLCEVRHSDDSEQKKKAAVLLSTD